MIVTVKYKSGAIRKMDKKYADILVKLKKVTYEGADTAQGAGSPVYETRKISATPTKVVKESKPKKEKKAKKEKAEKKPAKAAKEEPAPAEKTSLSGLMNRGLEALNKKNYPDPDEGK